jgi:hypothetical protein
LSGRSDGDRSQSEAKRERCPDGGRYVLFLMG